MPQKVWAALPRRASGRTSTAKTSKNGNDKRKEDETSQYNENNSPAGNLWGKVNTRKHPGPTLNTDLEKKAQG